MFVRLDKKVSIARFFTFLGYGERMAHNCAKAQAALAAEPGMRRFLVSQAKQEAMHALAFQSTIA